MQPGCKRSALGFALWGATQILGCAHPTPASSFLEREARFIRLGVDLEQEERAVRAVLAQRHLSVVGSVRAPGLIALSARTFEARLSAVRVITGRGVVQAEDAATDDLFSPGSVELLRQLPTSLGEYTVVAWVRVPLGHDLGCAALLRVLEDGNVVPGVLDVSTFGPRACVAELHRDDDGRLTGTVAFPGLRAETVPHILVELQFPQVPIGYPTPYVPVMKIRGEGTWLDAERSHWEAPLPGNASFGQKHAVGVARAAVALLAGQESAAQLAAYRQAVGRVAPGSAAADLVADTLAYFKRGWLEKGQAVEDLGAGDEVIEPEPTLVPEAEDASPELTEDVQVIEPNAESSSTHEPPGSMR